MYEYGLKVVDALTAVLALITPTVPDATAWLPSPVRADSGLPMPSGGSLPTGSPCGSGHPSSQFVALNYRERRG
jgi:hypothetical protein